MTRNPCSCGDCAACTAEIAAYEDARDYRENEVASDAECEARAADEFYGRWDL